MKTPTQVHALLTNRRKDTAPQLAIAARIRDVYNGDMVVPLPELNADEMVSTENLLRQAVDQTAMRVASTMFDMYWPARKPGQKASEAKAALRRNVVIGWHDAAKMNTKMGRRGRHMLGYGHSPVWIRAGDEGRPFWHVRDPLETYPAPCLDPDELVPPDAICTFKRSAEWLRTNYPDKMLQLRAQDTTRSFEIVEYADAEQCLTYVVGDPDYNRGYGMGPGSGEYVVLHDYENRAQRPLVVDPARTTLGRRSGAYDGMVGMYQLQSKIQALTVIGMQRGIFPETWFVASQAGGKIIKHADPFHGVIGEAEAGDIKTVQMQPSYMAPQMVDRLAGAQRAEGAMPAEYSGLSGSNIRTGVRGANVMSAAIDYYIQEAQLLFERSIEEENKIAVAINKAYAGNHTYSMYVRGVGQLTYTPNDTFETDVHEVRYPYAGADANGLEIRIGQELGEEVISRRTAMEHNPLIRDVNLELTRIESEGLRKAFMVSLDQMVADPNSPLLPSDVADIYRYIAVNRMEPWDAYQKVKDEIAAKQADQQANPPQPGTPGAQPGMEVPAGQRPELAGVAPPAQGLANVSQLLGALRRPARSLPAEQVPSSVAG